MWIKRILPQVLFFCSIIAAPSPPRTPSSILPFSTKGRDIIDSRGDVFRYMSVNWPGHQELMIPEGLQHSSIEKIVSWIPKLGLNSVRITFAIEMVDDIYANNPNQTLEKTIVNTLGQETGNAMLSQILMNNPGLSKNMTRLQVWDEVAKELNRQGVFIHLDNHVSKAFWCCGKDDGNGWFGEKYFNVANWQRGLAHMAKHAKLNWPSFASVGLRNELRSSRTSPEPVDWYTWHTHMTAAASAVHAASPTTLIFFSGMDFDTYISPIPLGQALKGTKGTSTAHKSVVFTPTDYPWHDKIVLEVHKYDYDHTHIKCKRFKKKWYKAGFQALNPHDKKTKFLFPLVVSEWGFVNDGEYWKSTAYVSCLIDMVEEWKMGWMVWELSGSWYLQTEPKRHPATMVNVNETWGLLNYDWSALRSKESVHGSLMKMTAALRG